MLTTVCERLQHAKARIIQKGWVQDAYRKYGEIDGFGAACLVGSLMTDEEYKLFQHNGPRAVPQLLEAVQALGFNDRPAAFVWNDAPSRTQAQVIARIDEAIAKNCVEETK